MIATNGMVEVCCTLLLVHIDNLVPKISFRTVVILTRTASTRSYQYRNTFSASQHGIVIICTSMLVAFIEDANLIDHLLRYQKDIGICQVHHLGLAASA